MGAYSHLGFVVEGDHFPQEKRYVYDDEPECAERDTVEFRLIYDGRLPSQTKSNSRVTDKHAIRKIFHKQLANLWS